MTRMMQLKGEVNIGYIMCALVVVKVNGIE